MLGQVPIIANHRAAIIHSIAAEQAYKVDTKKSPPKAMSPTTFDSEQSTIGTAAQMVLVIDDDAMQREVLTRLLVRAGQTLVLTASSGNDALDCMATHGAQIGLIICDLQMPGMDGMELLRHIAESVHKPTIIISSATESRIMSSVELMVKAIGLNVLGSLPKPVSQDAISKLLDRYIHAAAFTPLASRVVLQGADVDRAFEAGEFEPYFQPKVSLATGELIGVEALSRWIHPEHGILRPADFLPLIESQNKLEKLTQTVIASTLRHAGDWKKHGRELTININLSLSAIDNVSLCEDTLSLLSANGLKPRDLTFEIVETAAMTDVGRTLETMNRLRLNGFGLSIDDFGTGYSSFEQLARIPFTELKIDRSFVAGAAQAPRLAAVVRSCIDLAARLNLNVVAEGVESQDDWEFLDSVGANEAQGYFIATPMPGGRILSWADRWIALGTRSHLIQTGRFPKLVAVK
jgi:EAL domain-containing protein (putative c-di-GMP-specific phosphodiesterase class I)/ActR/RegA family two-component response regulator